MWNSLINNNIAVARAITRQRRSLNLSIQRTVKSTSLYIESVLHDGQNLASVRILTKHPYKSHHHNQLQTQSASKDLNISL